MEELVALEESGPAQEGKILEAGDIPESARWSHVVVAFTSTPGIGRLLCARYLHESTGEVLIVEELFKFYP